MENRKGTDPFGGQFGHIQVPDRGIADAGAYSILNGIMMFGLGMLAQENERNYQEKIQAQRIAELEKQHAYELRAKELELMGRAQVEAKQQPPQVNPYRGANTVAELEKILLGHSPSPQREAVLRELAKYPETMPLAQLPATTTRLLTGK